MTKRSRAFETWHTQSVALDPSLPDGHVQLAYLHLYKRNHGEAEKEAREAIRLGGDQLRGGLCRLGTGADLWGGAAASRCPHGEGHGSGKGGQRRYRPTTSANSARPTT